MFRIVRECLQQDNLCILLGIIILVSVSVYYRRHRDEFHDLDLAPFTRMGIAHAATVGGVLFLTLGISARSDTRETAIAPAPVAPLVQCADLTVHCSRNSAFVNMALHQLANHDLVSLLQVESLRSAEIMNFDKISAALESEQNGVAMAKTVVQDLERQLQDQDRHVRHHIESALKEDNTRAKKTANPRMTLPRTSSDDDHLERSASILCRLSCRILETYNTTYQDTTEALVLSELVERLPRILARIEEASIDTAVVASDNWYRELPMWRCIISGAISDIRKCTAESTMSEDERKTVKYFFSKRTRLSVGATQLKDAAKHYANSVRDTISALTVFKEETCTIDRYEGISLAEGRDFTERNVWHIDEYTVLRAETGPGSDEGSGRGDRVDLRKSTEQVIRYIGEVFLWSSRLSLHKVESLEGMPLVPEEKADAFDKSAAEPVSG